MSKCPNCGGDLNYNVKDTVVKCEYCGSTFNPKELDLKTKYVKETETFEGKSFNCTQCGAQLLAFDETAVTFCSYCGSQSIIESKMVKINNPDYIIPFTKTKEECIAAYKKHMQKALFVPKYMKEDMTIEKIRGIYMPYGIYKASIHGNTQNHGEKYSHRSGDYVYYDQYTIDAHVDADYEGMSFDLLSKFYDSYSMSIPFDYSGVQPFNKNYLMGFYADTKDVDGSIYDNEAEEIATNNSRVYMSKRREFSRYGCHSPKAKLKVSERKMAMFPVYFLGVKDKENKMHYAVINGQTGKVAADLPIDFIKFVFGTFIIALIIFGLLNLGSVILPKTVLIISLVAAVISMIISISQLRKVFDKERHLDDEGYLSKNKSDVQIMQRGNTKDKFKNGNVGVLFFTFAMILFIGITFGGTFLSTIFSNAKPHVIMMILLPIGLFLIVAFSKHRNNKKSEVKIDAYKDGKKLKKVKASDLKFQLISLIIGILVLMSGTIKDEIIYGSSIAIFVLIILSFNSLIKEHNILSSNKPPQLEKRGGDEVGK